MYLCIAYCDEMKKGTANAPIPIQFKFNLILIKFLGKKPKEFTWVKVKLCFERRRSSSREVETKGKIASKTTYVCLSLCVCAIQLFCSVHVYIVHFIYVSYVFFVNIHGATFSGSTNFHSLSHSFWFTLSVSLALSLRMYTMYNINMIMVTFNVKWKITIANRLKRT